MAHRQHEQPIPKSYTELLVKDITVSHYPSTSPVATDVIIVTLNRPKQRNAFTRDMMSFFELCYPLFDRDERVKSIVLTGAGDFFCAGADLDIGFNAPGERERVIDHRDR
jgi:enoyl-CoA hydratase/carnithine racemase